MQEFFDRMKTRRRNINGASDVTVVGGMQDGKCEQACKIFLSLPYNVRVQKVKYVLAFARELAVDINNTLIELRPYLRHTNSDEMKQAIHITTWEIPNEIDYFNQICLEWVDILILRSDNPSTQPRLSRSTTIQESIDHVDAANRQLVEAVARGRQRLNSAHCQGQEHVMVAVLAEVRQALMVLQQHSEEMRLFNEPQLSLVQVNEFSLGS